MTEQITQFHVLLKICCVVCCAHKFIITLLETARYCLDYYTEVSEERSNVPLDTL